jgi:hypothetical protein
MGLQKNSGNRCVHCIHASKIRGNFAFLFKTQRDRDFSYVSGIELDRGFSYVGGIELGHRCECDKFRHDLCEVMCSRGII